MWGIMLPVRRMCFVGRRRLYAPPQTSVASGRLHLYWSGKMIIDKELGKRRGEQNHNVGVPRDET